MISTSKHNRLHTIAFDLLYFSRRGWGGKFWKEKDWIIKSFSKVTVTIYELLCSSLHIIINVFNTVSGKIIKQAVVSTVMLNENSHFFSFDLCFSKICDGLKSVSILSSFLCSHALFWVFLSESPAHYSPTSLLLWPSMPGVGVELFKV